MRKLFLTIATFFCVTGVFAATPDYDAIEKAVIDLNSPYYYPTLIARYMRGDTTLTANDYRHLYYGYVFQESYKPLDPISEEATVLAILDANRTLSEEDARQVIYYAEQVMQRDPFSLSNINFMTYAYGRLGDTEKEKISAARMKGVFEAIDASGDGEKEQTAWHVILFAHVNDFMAIKGYDVRGRRVVSRTVEYVTVPRHTDSKNKGYYFNFSKVYSKPPTVMPEKPKGIKPKW